MQNAKRGLRSAIAERKQVVVKRRKQKQEEEEKASGVGGKSEHAPVIRLVRVDKPGG